MTHESLSPREFILATECNGNLTQLAWKDDDGNFHWTFFTCEMWINYPWPEDQFLNYLIVFPEENICRFYMEP